MNALQIGSVVRYHNDYHVVVGLNSRLAKIIAPHRSNRKLNVSHSKCNVGPTLPIVRWLGNDYIVTPRGLIISMTSQRLIKPDAPLGIGILGEAKRAK